MTTHEQLPTLVATVQPDAGHSELYAWAAAHDLTGPQSGTARRELRKIGIDYDALRQAAARKRLAELTAAASEGVPSIHLAAAGAAATNTYTVRDGQGGLLWQGTFHDRDRYHRKGDQVSADTSAATKAIFLASKARQLAKTDLARLHLTLTNPRVDTAVLVREATAWRLLLDIDIDIDDDPADPPVVTNGHEFPTFYDWNEADLAALIRFTTLADDGEDQR
ncbi:hypothetical protein ACIRRA_39850 [Nocardia sp. NPDC101769]|uniref:hypothetical protein n=1 Tax=Nocardia sp. NPDC101769 TaxID=3364333 RepID=UPI00382FAA53